MSIIQEICRENGFKIHYGKYRMWHSVPFIGKTALVIDDRIYNGGYCIIQNPNLFPDVVDKKYILDAINAGAFSLGEFIKNKRETPVFTPFDKRTGYPAGFFTHKVGEDVSGK